MQDLGQYYLVALAKSVEPYTLALFTRELGYTSHRTRSEIEQVRHEIAEMVRTKRNMHMEFYFVYGRKPQPLQ
jgi:hypothetical protein